MDRGLLALGGVAQPEPLEADTSLPEGGRTDAEIMLQVKAGDDAAFEYLVQKYRRPMVSFMFRDGAQQRCSRGSGTGSFPAGLPLARKLRGQRQVQHVAVSHRDQPGSESCARYAP